MSKDASPQTAADGEGEYGRNHEASLGHARGGWRSSISAVELLNKFYTPVLTSVWFIFFMHICFSLLCTSVVDNESKYIFTLKTNSLRSLTIWNG